MYSVFRRARGPARPGSPQKTVGQAVRVRRVVAALWLIPLLVLLSTTGQLGCHLIYPFEVVAPECERYTCEGQTYYCLTFLEQFSQPPAVTLDTSATSTALLPNCYTPINASADNNPNPIKPSSEGLVSGVKAYCDGPWAISQLNYLKGAAWIPTRYEDRKNKAEHFLTIWPSKDMAAVHLAYDSRATQPPDWLSKKFEPETYMGYGDVYITIPDPTAAPNTKQELKLFLWKSKDKLKAGQPFVIPGNLYHKDKKKPPKFSVPEAPTMYMVILEPERQYDCSNLAKLTEGNKIFYDSCGKERECPVDQADAEKKAIAAFQQYYNDYAGYAYAVSCSANQECPKESDIAKITLALKSKVHNAKSEIRFNKLMSKATITLPTLDQKFISGVTGAIHFDYIMDNAGHLQTMDIRDMTLHVDDTWEIDTIVLSLVNAVEAECVDAQKPVGIPCGQYRIGVEKFIASLVGNHGSPDKKVMVVATNPKSALVTIDHKARSFTVKGLVSGSVKGEEGDTPIDVDVDVTGEFYNFAPQASAKESHPFSACDRTGTNWKPIALDASTSTDIDDKFGALAQPGNIVDYEWYQDFLEPTQKAWGKGKQVKIPAHSLRFGVHDFTLLVRDDKGVADTVDFPVTVTDDVPPVFTVPKDKFALMAWPESPPVKVALGHASASDNCSDTVSVTHDAPTGLLFGAGDHKVTWRADDGHGNVVTAAQYVHVWVLEGPKPASVLGLAFQLKSAFANLASELSTCTQKKHCDVELDSLQGAIGRLADYLAAPRVSKDGAVDFGQTSHILRQAAAQMQSAAAHIREANKLSTRREREVAKAIQRLEESMALMDRISDGLRAE